MQEFLKELIRIEINDTDKSFNGFYSAEAYTKYLNELYAAANMSILVDERYTAILYTQLKDFMTMLDAYLPMFAETVEDMRHDAEVDKNLKCEYDWYKMLFDIRNAKIYYYEELGKLLQPSTTSLISTSNNKENLEEEYISHEELIARYTFKGVKSVKDAKWRQKHNFYPCKQDGKGCALRISVSLLEEWLKGNNK